jgi:hypothetical protein
MSTATSTPKWQTCSDVWVRGTFREVTDSMGVSVNAGTTATELVRSGVGRLELRFRGRSEGVVFWRRDAGTFGQVVAPV